MDITQELLPFLSIILPCFLAADLFRKYHPRRTTGKIQGTLSFVSFCGFVWILGNVIKRILNLCIPCWLPVWNETIVSITGYDRIGSFLINFFVAAGLALYWHGVHGNDRCRTRKAIRGLFWLLGIDSPDNSFLSTELLIRYLEVKDKKRDLMIVVSLTNGKVYLGGLVQYTLDPNAVIPILTMLPMMSMSRTETHLRRDSVYIEEGQSFEEFLEGENELVIPWSQIITIADFNMEFFSKNPPK